MSLILDHINGKRDDHRIENLRILCPNCAATLETHCGRKNRLMSRTDRRPTPPSDAAQSKRKNVPTGSSLSGSIFGTAAASVAANVSPLASIRRMSSSTGVASAFTPLA